MSALRPVALEGTSAKMYEVPLGEDGLYLRSCAVEMPGVPRINFFRPDEGYQELHDIIPKMHTASRKLENDFIFFPGPTSIC